MRAFDYQNQVWIEGRAAAELRVQQIRETMAILDGPRSEAERYLRFLGLPPADLPEFRASLQAQLNDCFDQLAESRPEVSRFKPGRR